MKINHLTIDKSDTVFSGISLDISQFRYGRFQFYARLTDVYPSRLKKVEPSQMKMIPLDNVTDV